MGFRDFFKMIPGCNKSVRENVARHGLHRHECDGCGAAPSEDCMCAELGIYGISGNRDVPVFGSDDLACLRMFIGASFGPGFSLRLPSGMILSGDEIASAINWAMSGGEPPVISR